MKTLIEILSQLHVLHGDITVMKVDAIVNAANPSLLGGGGVDGAIHRAAGPRLLEACKKIGGCRPGEARLTLGYNLPAHYIIHTPGPIYRDGRSGEEGILHNAYLNAIKLAAEHRIHSIAFPSISTGVYGYPKAEACRIAVKTITDFFGENSIVINVYFVLFDKDNFTIYNNHIASLE